MSNRRKPDGHGAPSDDRGSGSNGARFSDDETETVAERILAEDKEILRRLAKL